MRPIFRDAKQQDAFDRNGYIVLDFLEPSEVSELQALWSSLPNDLAGMPFSNTIMSSDLNYRREVHDSIAAVFHSRAEAIFDGCRLCLCTFLRKAPSSEPSTVQLHQDWSFVDEVRHSSAAIWCPLVKVDHNNGCLQVVPGSHHLNSFPRGAHSAFPYTDLLEVIKRDYLVDIPMRAGQALVSSQRLFHSSPPNRSVRERVVAGGLCVPQESKMVFLARDSDDPGMLRVCEVADEFYQNFTYGTVPEEGTPISFAEAGYEPVSEERLHFILRQNNEDRTVKRGGVSASF